MPFTKINRNAYFFEIVAEQDITLDFEVILLPGQVSYANHPSLMLRNVLASEHFFLAGISFAKATEISLVSIPSHVGSLF
jgi:hypothetical protein